MIIRPRHAFARTAVHFHPLVRRLAPFADSRYARAAPTAGAEPSRTPAPHADAALVLEDGSVFWGRGAGAVGVAVGEICFNTSITGYQEILTDPSYAGQIITFTFPHIGNVGSNPEDIETTTSAARGCVLRARSPSRRTGGRSITSTPG